MKRYRQKHKANSAKYNKMKKKDREENRQKVENIYCSNILLKMLNYRSTHQFVTTLNIIFALYIVDHSL
jgi:hypothetical protein